MQNGSNEYLARVERARYRSVTATRLEWHERVLLAAVEAADWCVAPAVRAEMACMIADKAAGPLHDMETVRGVQVAIVDALASAGLAGRVPAPAVTRVAWRLVFDLWGGPDR